MSRLADWRNVVNEELRRQIDAKRTEHHEERKATGDIWHAGARDALEWVLDLLDAQPAAVSLPEEAEPPRMVVDEWGFPAFPAPAVSLELPEPPELLPAEKMALTVASAQVRRGDAVPPNTATMLVMALERLTASAEPPIEDAGSGGVR